MFNSSNVTQTDYPLWSYTIIRQQGICVFESSLSATTITELMSVTRNTHGLVGVRRNAERRFQAGPIFVHAERKVPVALVH